MEKGNKKEKNEGSSPKGINPAMLRSMHPIACLFHVGFKAVSVFG
jgi:hypothetical protein